MNVQVSNITDKTVVDLTKSYSATDSTVRKLREDINSKPGKLEIYEVELTEIFAKNHVKASFVMPLLSLVIATVGTLWIGVYPAIMWFSATAISYLLLTFLSKRFLRENAIGETVTNWQRIFLLSQLLLTMNWSIYVLFGISSDLGGIFTIVQFTTILVIQAATAMLTYGLRQSILLICGLPTLILATRLLITQEPAMMMMGTLLLGALFFVITLADRFKQAVLTIMEHKGRNETLMAELETVQAISEEARRRAEEANLAKSRFLATMSHELRTPLNAILGFSEIMKNEALGPMQNNTYKNYAGDIHSSGDHLLKVINEILDLSRIEAGRQELNESAMLLSHVVDEARNMTLLKAKNKGITIKVNTEPDLPQIWADERAVRQITLNLLANAVKFTPKDGRVEIKVGWTRSGGQYLSISDNGPGIPEEEIPIVLSSFGQGSIAIKSAEQGSGLGLPIVQALMHMHEGRFELKSKLREGTKVTATFPRHRVLEIMPPVDETRNKDYRRKALAKRRMSS
ncbi:MAG: HAMP domain-containing histidine kinase [Rhizobiaceae bacterium]|nr:HAMP domain-containing histidine kinase [Rhizobiaceae bacterium]